MTRSTKSLWSRIVSRLTRKRGGPPRVEVVLVRGSAMTSWEVSQAIELRANGWTCKQVSKYLGGLTPEEISEVTR